MQIAVAYSEPSNQVWLRIEVPEDTTVEQAIVRSGILRLFPHIDLTRQKVGIYGKLTKLDAIPQPGDRIEIYREIIADPKQVPRRRTAAEDDED
ncbi:MAG: RnfH family protein [Burkholderiales bacterium]|nr:RnfH family protein [Burkholderiales bacterium]